ncbi:MAG TPA: alpha-glucan phosphorylase, partial [Dehalococcoidia bacterium]|nr:alpha-glucan phosphorylase [Dehalococcoidia bacterium]
QRISNEGWQEELYQQLDFNQAPIHPVVLDKEGNTVLSIQLRDNPLYYRAWQVNLGQVRVYLLDTGVEENVPFDRMLSARLYAADRDQRVQQEMLLGIGGVQLLRKLGINPVVWHANEGHTAFMMVERVREEVKKGKSFTDAVSIVKANTIFTTHTPVPAGHDIFATSVIDKYINGYWNDLGIDRQDFLSLGQTSGSETGSFNMTTVALKLSDHRCCVSQLHGQVTRRMWQQLWPDVNEDDIPITHTTNGIHFPSWIAPELYELLSKYLGDYLMKRHDDPRVWQRINEIPDSEFWAARQTLRRKLLHIIGEHAQQLWNVEGATAEQVLATGALLDTDSMTIGFCRRFTEYKRPALIFSDIERLKRIVTNPLRPVQIVFAGKSHPADNASKHLLQRVYNLAKDRAFFGRIAFVEDYDMHMARYLVQGVDVWLNTPRRLQEACGTSGMKAAINGIPNISVPDGWWVEGYNGANGWTIGEKSVDQHEEDRIDALSLYKLLEEEIVPLYYERDHQNIPHGWIKVAKEAIRSVAPQFSARRMLKEYTTNIQRKCMW